MTSKQISIFLENRPGALMEVCETLESEKINMRAMCVGDAEEFGVLRLIVDDPFHCMTVLKDHDYVCSLTDVLTIEIGDYSGALISTFRALSEAGVNIEYSYAFLSKKKNSAYLVLRVRKPERAIEKLAGTDIHIISQEEISEIFS